MAGDAEATIPIRVVPRAKRTQVGGEREGRLVVHVAAPPVDGKANAAAVAALAAALGVPKRSVEIVRGAGSRDKLVRVAGVAAGDPRLSALR